MDELHVIAALLNSREAYEVLRGSLLLSDFSEFGAVVVKRAVDYYDKDPSAKSVDRDLLRTALNRLYPNPKQCAALVDYLDSIPREVSELNAAGVYREMRLRTVGLNLADSLLQGKPDTRALIDKYLKLAEEPTTKGALHRLTYEDIYATNTQGKIKVYPERLNTLFRGGIRPGHNGLIFGRPGAGKTLVTVNIVAGMAHAGHRVLYIANEEPVADITRRFLSRLTKYTLWDMNQADLEKEKEAFRNAEALASKRGFQNVLVTDEASTMRECEALINAYKPNVLVLDQIRHVEQKMELLQRQEAVTRWMRDIADDKQMITIGTAQAGASANNKAVLGLTDLDYSNTGVQGACDWMLGVGLTEDMKRIHKRNLCICRNKVSGTEAIIPVWFDEQHTAVRNTPR